MISDVEKIDDFKFCVPFVLSISLIPIIIPRYSMMTFSTQIFGKFPGNFLEPGSHPRQILSSSPEFWYGIIIIEMIGMVMKIMLINSTIDTQNLKSSIFSTSDVKKKPISFFFDFWKKMKSDVTSYQPRWLSIDIFWFLKSISRLEIFWYRMSKKSKISNFVYHLYYR